jgi:sec-independent protein translocase protein TatC
LSRMGVVTADFLRQKRRYAILLIFVVAAVLTPPDVVSQFMMALPLIALYEISILVAKIAGKKNKETEEET